MNRSTIWIRACAISAALVACSNPRDAPPAPAAVVAEVDLVGRGKELVQLGGCGDCHTPVRFDPQLGVPVPRMDRMLSGHPPDAPEPQAQPGEGDLGVIGASFTAFRMPFGVVYASNLTPHRETGLGSWTAEEFVQTMRTGHQRGEGRALLPPMPWLNLSQQPDANLRAIFAYLHSVPAVDNRVPEAAVPAEVRVAMAKSNALNAKAAHTEPR